MNYILAVVSALLALGLAPCVFGFAAHDEHHHTCQHNHPALKSPLQFTTTPPEQAQARRRGMQAAGLNDFGTIRILINTTFLDQPTLDRAANGNLASCANVGDIILVNTAVTSHVGLQPCVNGSTRFVGNCYVECTESDVVTAARRSKLLTDLGSVRDYYQSFLQVQQLTSTANEVVPNAGYNCGNLPLSSQTLDTDVVVYVTMRSMPYLPSTLAFASPCQLHADTSRPIVMFVNVQPRTVDTNSDMATVLRHELMHGFGFSTDLYRHYRHPSDRSKTYYEYDSVRYPFGPLTGSPGAVVMNTELGRFGPAVNLSYLGPGHRVALVTPNVVAFAREYFNCSTLTDVELENDGDAASAGTHWEERILYWELMTAVQKTTPGKFTNFTMALLQDMGFYDVRRTAADPMDFGLRKGCGFVTSRCNESNWYFCEQESTAYCGYNNQYVGQCNLQTFAADAIPVPYRYFPLEPNRAGADPFTNRCPFSAPTTGGFCTSATPNANLLSGTGQGARCFRSGVARIGQALGGGTVVTCFNIVCLSESTYMTKLDDEYVACRRDVSIELVTYPRSPYYVANVTKTPFISSKGMGILKCADPTPMCSTDIASLNPDMPRASSWPTIGTILPSSDVSIGVKVTVTGINLDACDALRIGGVEATSFVRVNGSFLTAVVADIVTPYGGSGAGGLGATVLDVKCRFGGHCPDGCWAAQAAVTLVEPPNDNNAPSLTDFISSTPGKIILGVLGALVVAGLGLLIKGLCCTKNDQLREEDSARYSLRNRDQELL